MKCLAALVLATGIIAIVASARGSQTYWHKLAALGVSCSIAFLMVWLQDEAGHASYQNLIAKGEMIDASLAASDLAAAYACRALYLAIGIAGLPLALISLLIRKGSKRHDLSVKATQPESAGQADDGA